MNVCFMYGVYLHEIGVNNFIRHYAEESNVVDEIDLEGNWESFDEFLKKLPTTLL